MAFTAQVLTLFPKAFPGPLGISVPGKALEKGVWKLETFDIRGFATDKHRTVDGTPAGGGPGMVMRPDVLALAIDAARGKAKKAWPLVCLSPRGKVFDQAMAREWANAGGVTLICGRFEAIDQRVLEAREVEEVSIGDFVLSGGEPAAMVVLDAVVRLLPGVVGEPASLAEESFSAGLLEYPQYTRPQVWEGRAIPDVLLSGHHEKIEAWRREKAEQLTRRRRPDLWQRRARGKKQVKP